MKEEKWKLWLRNKNILEKDFKIYMKKKLIIKTAISSILASSHLEKAFHNLDLSSFIFENQANINKRTGSENYNDSVMVFAYYAMYHAALAMLFTQGYKSKSHTATICFLCKECEELDEKDIEKISMAIERKNIEEIGEGQQRREKASYQSSISFNAELAKMTLDDARDFVTKIYSILTIKKDDKK